MALKRSGSLFLHGFMCVTTAAVSSGARLGCTYVWSNGAKSVRRNDGRRQWATIVTGTMIVRDWPSVVGATPVRLVIPLRVVEELDLKKASRRRDLAHRARNVLALLESLVGPTAGLPTQMDDNATVEVLLDHEFDSVRQERESSADTEILDACEFLAFVTGQPVSLVTGDVSMRLRVAVRGWKAVTMPDELRATLDDAAEPPTR